MAVLLPGLAAIRYTGELSPRRLWEIGGADIPFVRKGDIVLVSVLTAAVMTKKADFEPVDIDAPLKELEGLLEHRVQIDEIDVNPLGAGGGDAETPAGTPEAGTPEAGTPEAGTPEEQPLPFADEINVLNKERLIEIAKQVGIKYGRKSANDLRALILPYLPVRKG